MAGMLVGSFVFGYIADLVGRRNALHLSTIVLVAAGTASALLPEGDGRLHDRMNVYPTSSK